MYGIKKEYTFNVGWPTLPGTETSVEPVTLLHSANYLHALSLLEIRQVEFRLTLALLAATAAVNATSVVGHAQVNALLISWCGGSEKNWIVEDLVHNLVEGSVDADVVLR